MQLQLYLRKQYLSFTVQLLSATVEDYFAIISLLLPRDLELSKGLCNFSYCSLEVTLSNPAASLDFD